MLLSLFLREADERELRAAFGHSGTPAELQGYVDNSADAWACYDNTRIMCAFGVARYPGSSALAPVGLPWMLGTDRVKHNARSLIQATRAYLAEMLKDFPLLVNFIDARNAESLRYMRACGATIDPAQPYGVEGLPFHRFSLER